MRKLLLIVAVLAALVAGGWADGGWAPEAVSDSPALSALALDSAEAANDEPGGGGGFYRVCNNGWTYVYYGGSWGWRPDGTTCT